MRTIKLKVQDSVYVHIMYLLKSLNQKEIEIIEDKPLTQVQNTKQAIKDLFEKKNVSLFKAIKDPVKWQQQQREEW